MDKIFFEKVNAYLIKTAENNNGHIENEETLAKRFNVSRYKVRQVLGVLVQMGALDRSPRRGSILKAPDKIKINDQLKLQFDIASFDASEYLEARILVECAIIPLITRRVTPLMMTQLENILGKIAEHADSPMDADKYDRDFHLLLLKACGNRVLQVFSGVLVTYFEKTSGALTSRDRQYFIDTAEKEKRILLYIKNGNAKKAADLMREHLLETEES
jgi:DNA-binding FadR family transcriptional regulator